MMDAVRAAGGRRRCANQRALTRPPCERITKTVERPNRQAGRSTNDQPMNTVAYGRFARNFTFSHECLVAERNLVLEQNLVVEQVNAVCFEENIVFEEVNVPEEVNVFAERTFLLPRMPCRPARRAVARRRAGRAARRAAVRTSTTTSARTSTTTSASAGADPPGPPADPPSSRPRCLRAAAGRLQARQLPAERGAP
jgi:hypothetical protein